MNKVIEKNLWFSQKQKDSFADKTPAFGKLDADGSIVEYTEARGVGDDDLSWEDAVCLGVGVFDHHGEQQ